MVDSRQRSVANCACARARDGRWWRGGACSGTDSVVTVLEHLGRSSGRAFTHAFSCECGEATEIGSGRASHIWPRSYQKYASCTPLAGAHVVTGEVRDVPVCGFVCDRFHVQVRVYRKHNGVHIASASQTVRQRAQVTRQRALGGFPSPAHNASIAPNTSIFNRRSFSGAMRMWGCAVGPADCSTSNTTST